MKTPNSSIMTCSTVSSPRNYTLKNLNLRSNKTFKTKYSLSMSTLLIYLPTYCPRSPLKPWLVSVNCPLVELVCLRQRETRSFKYLSYQSRFTKESKAIRSKVKLWTSLKALRDQWKSKSLRRGLGKRGMLKALYVTDLLWGSMTPLTRVC